MHLVVFDIDGTLVDSVKVDDQCFIQSFMELFELDLSEADWNSFKHVTDSGLTHEIFENHFKRAPREEEIVKLKSHFYQLTQQRIDEFKEIKGATKALDSLSTNSRYMVAFATGGWRETAELKLGSIGVEVGDLTLISSNDHHVRSEITNRAIEDARVKAEVRDFESITYVGDGLWDMNASAGLGINFIGVDYQCNDKLINAGAKHVLNDLEHLEEMLSSLIGE